MVALNQHDLEFILKQIRIAEAHANGTPLTEIRLDANGRVITDRAWYTSAGFDPTLPLAIPDAKTPYGLRTVDGSYNNLIEGREFWGASNQPMPRLLNPNFINEGDDSMALGGGQSVTNNNYGVVGAPTPGVNGGHSGNVADADPRLISNLVADMSFNNPAAIVAALTFAGSADVYGDLAVVRAAHAALISAIVAVNADAGIDEAAKQAARDAAQAEFDLVLEAKGLEAENGSLIIPNVALAALGTKQKDLRLAGRARGRVQDHRRAVLIALEPGEVAEGRGQIQAGHDVRLVDDRQLGQVVQRADVARLDALRAPQAAVEGRLPSPVHAAHEQAVLMRVQLIAADACDKAGEVVADGVVARQGGRIHVLPIGAVGVGHTSLPAASRKARAASCKVSKSSSMAASGS